MSTAELTLSREKEFLDRVFHTYRTEVSPQMRVMQELAIRTFAPYLSGGLGLELGCSDGFLTESIAERVVRLDVVDGSKKFLERASERELGNVTFIHSLFEEFRSDEQYDYVFGSYILEHVIDPITVLRVAHEALKPGGHLFVLVPNARALSRQLAVHMGLLPDLKELTKNDHDHGHRRVYDRVSLNRDIHAAGFEIISQGGLFLKLLADFQMDELIDRGTLKQQHLDGLYTLGLEYPDLCGSIFAICKKGK